MVRFGGRGGRPVTHPLVEEGETIGRELIAARRQLPATSFGLRLAPRRVRGSGRVFRDSLGAGATRAFQAPVRQVTAPLPVAASRSAAPRKTSP